MTNSSHRAAHLSVFCGLCLSACAGVAQTAAPADTRDFVEQTHPKEIRKLADSTIPPLKDAELLTLAITNWLRAAPEGSKLVFPEGRYWVTAGFYLKNGMTVLGANATIGSGETLSIQDKTIFIVHPQAPKRSELRAAGKIDAAVGANSLAALFYARRGPDESAKDITIRGVTIDLRAPEYPAAFEEDPERSTMPSAIRLENPSSCRVEQVHVRNAYSAAISLGTTRPGFDFGYGHSSPCALTASHQISQDQYARKDASCSASFLLFRENAVRACLVENYRHLARMDAKGVIKPLFSPPHVVGIELAAMPETAALKLQVDRVRTPDFPSFTLASSLGENTIEGNRLLGGEYGISVVNSVLNRVQSNFAAMNTHRGISFQRGADYNVIYENHVAGNGGSGIHIANDADGNVIVRNTVDAAGFVTDELGAIERSKDGALQLLDGESDGIKVYVNSNRNKISKNIIRNARHAGVRVGHHAIGTEINENQISIELPVMQDLVALDRRIIKHEVAEPFITLPVGMRLAAVFAEQREAIPFGAEFYSAGERPGRYEKAQSQAALAQTMVTNNSIRGTWRGIVLGDDSARHVPAGAGDDEAEVRPSVHDNVITDNEIALSPAASELTSLTSTGVPPAANTPAAAKGGPFISGFSFNDDRIAGNRGLACDPSLRMANNKIARNWDTTGKRTLIDGDQSKVSPRLK